MRQEIFDLLLAGEERKKKKQGVSTGRKAGL